MKYVDGYLLVVPKKKLDEYRRMAQLGGKLWKEHGALDYRECVIDDATPEFGMPFPRLVKAKPAETVIFSYIVFKSRAHRDKVNAKVMSDPRLKGDVKSMPFEPKRMSWGGFKTIVEK